MNRCLAPGMNCANRAIRAHSVQNSRILDMLAHNGHLKALSPHATKENFEIVLEDVGRNRATTFEGLCSYHDAEIFRPIEEGSICIHDPQHLFLLAYRATVRELHTLMSAAIKTQGMYNKRIELGLDKGNEPEAAGVLALDHMVRAHSVYVYKEHFDRALRSGRYSDILHKVVTVQHEEPTIAVCSLYSVDDVRREGNWVQIALNVFPLSRTASAVIFGFTPSDAELALASLHQILNSEGVYQKYLISKLVLNNCENFVMSPAYCEQWTEGKQEDVISYFEQTLFAGDLDVENPNLYLF